MNPRSEEKSVSRSEFDLLRNSVRRIEDFRAIETLKYRYFRSIDTADHSLLRSLLHKDLRVDIRGGDYQVKIKGADGFVGFIRDTVHAEIVALHQGHHPEIELLSDTEATGLWYLWDDFWDLAAKTRMYGSALYRDRYEKIDGRWVISETGYERVFEAVDRVRRPPRLVRHMLAERGVRHFDPSRPIDGGC